MAVPPGKIVYTQFLNAAAGIEADVTVTRLSHDEFLVVSTILTFPQAQPLLFPLLIDLYM